eukprot:Phypoly_transcript_09405.p1 GENE.Phypoly_transcript_09405~~Phypoly_transcript_09405.p1  ORF type:complete len:355 (+),score=41.64 Phypoly_transcript_09405:188-1252(+)
MMATKVHPPAVPSKLNPNATPFIPGRPNSPSLADVSQEAPTWNLEQAKKHFSEYKTRDLIGHKKKIHSVAWNCNGRKLASGSVDQTVRVWNIETNKDLELKGHTDSVDQLCWDPTHPDVLCTASADKTIRIWDTRTGKCTHNITTTGENINVAWSPDGNYVAVGNKEDCVTIIDTRKYNVLCNHRFHYEVNEIGWNNTGELFFLTTGLGTVEVLRWIPGSNELKPLRSIHAHTANTYCIEFDPLNKYFAVGSADAVVTLWDINEMVCVRSFCKLQYPLRTISFSHDGQFLALASEDHIIDIAHVETGTSVFQISTDAAMNAVAWHPRQMILAYAGDEKDHHGRDLGAVRLFGAL